MFFGDSDNGTQSLFRWRFVLSIALAWGLIYADQRLGNITSGARNQISSWVIIPVRLAAQLPTAAWSTTSDYFKTREELIVAKQELEEQLLRERVRQRLLRQVEKENINLRRLVEVRQRVAPQAIVAEVINTSSLPFINRIVLNKGAKDGIRQGRGVFNEGGVIGRLTRVDQATSQALLLTDKRFWVATRSQRNNSLVLLQGAGGGRMRIRFVPADVDLQRGDVLVTAGGAGPFPAGLPVAVMDATWVPDGIPFQEGEAIPLASIRQETALLVHEVNFADVPDTTLPVSDSGAVPANFAPDILP